MSLDRIGKYRIVSKIGEGAMGEVYKAHDPLLNRFVALKTIAPGLVADPQFRERFKREAQSAAGLNHPNIITVYDYGDEGGITFLAMEFLEGSDLREAIRSHALGHLGRKIEVMEQLCEGIGFAHSRGVVHRDLKPGNIHIQATGHVKVLDFGLARLAASEMTRTGTVMGTPHYMAPEQLRGQKADARSDVFALGAIFYELLSGVRAFEGQMHEVMQRMRERDPMPLRQRAPATPLALATLVDKAMARDPEARFKDASELGRAVVQAREDLAGETLAAPPVRDEDSERTLLQAAGATILEPRRPATVHGTSALDVRRQHEPARTVRPDATVASGPATEVGRRFRPLLVGGAALALAGVAAAVVWLRPRPNAAPTADAPASQAAQDQLGVITDVVVTGKLELARADLENRDYAAAIAGAREALQFDPANAEAKALIAQAERTQRELDAAVAEARAAVGRGDTGRATAALGQVLQLDPRHPVADELKASLNQAFRQQADEARRLSVEARAAADKARATSLPDYAAARTLATQADASFGREDYTGAAQKFFAARNGFEAARRAADAARVVAADAARVAAAPTPRPTAAAYATVPPPTTAPTSAAPAPPQPTYVPPPSAAPVPQPTIASNPVSTPSLPAPATSQPDAGDAAVRRVLADYERAIEGKDINLFRSLMPGLSADAEKRLREAFGAVKSQDVGIAVDSVLVEGDRATVRVHRQDTISGRKQTATQQVFRLARSGGVWQIVSIGQ
ncbi:MAG TPA: serine/threonine-protein kinase [Vicinamibacteria bacterium]|jgi:tRNA A-37 threonylcarbamoyl transferase component Bud32/tetratricopeptide (TPR) repeat protein